MQNSHLSLGHAKAAPFRAWAMRSGVAGASVFNTCKSGANFRAAERSAAEPSNGEAAFQPEGASRAAASDTARLSPAHLK